MNSIRSYKGRVSQGTVPSVLMLAIAGILLILGYRRWRRRKAAHSHAGRDPREDVQAKADRLSEKFHSLEQEAQSGFIPKDLEKEPKNLDQTIHPR